MTGSVVCQSQGSVLEVGVELSRIGLRHQQLSKVECIARNLLRRASKLLVAFKDAAESRLEHVSATRTGGHNTQPRVDLAGQGLDVSARHRARRSSIAVGEGWNSAALR